MPDDNRSGHRSSSSAPREIRRAPSQQSGFSLVELLVVVVIVIIMAAMGIPKLMTMVGNLKTRGDARDLNEAVILAKMRAASDFARARVYADLSANTFRIEVYPSGATSWTAEGGDQLLSKGVTFGYGSLTTAPAGTQSTFGQAPLCLQNDLTSTYANTACIMFNSRGVPVGSTWAPTPNDALYVTDGKSVTGVTVSATGLTKIWRSDASTADWNQN
jgi:prepilin-type N-terminal cleavage/methylation domain-containing protein